VSAILIVDDEPQIRDLLARWLEDAKHATSQAPDAETAFDMMTKRPADVVLCDIEMPGKGGLWLVPKLRDQFPQSAVILATGVDSVPPSISLRGGVVRYLVKPFTRERVLSAVNEALQWTKAAKTQTGPDAANDPVGAWLGASLSAKSEK
jgi:sigma-B regulation protein RsbU (phosphoserine phosphatase)